MRTEALKLAVLDDNGNLTALGGIMAEFPWGCHLQTQAVQSDSVVNWLAKVLIVSPEFKCSDEILIIISMLSSGQPCVFSLDMFDIDITAVPNVWLRRNNQHREVDIAKN